MWWFLKKLLDDSEQVVYTYGFETREPSLKSCCCSICSISSLMKIPLLNVRFPLDENNFILTASIPRRYFYTLIREVKV